MLDGKISEILNGEGKTYTITLVAYVNSLYSDKVFILDDSVYLTERNYKWMRGLYGLLGLKTGCLIPCIEPFAEDPQIIYAHFPSFGFKVLHWENGRQLPAVDLSRCSAIVDEADTLLIEKADTPILTSRAPTPGIRPAVPPCLRSRLPDPGRRCLLHRSQGPHSADPRGLPPH